MLRFHLPLIEPDVRISRIRLSDKDSCVRPREVGAVAAAELDQTQLSCRYWSEKRDRTRPLHLVLPHTATDGAYDRRGLITLR